MRHLYNEVFKSYSYDAWPIKEGRCCELCNLQVEFSETTPEEDVEREKLRDVAKADSQAFVRGTEADRLARARAGPQAVAPGGELGPGSSEGVRRAIEGYMPIAGPKAQEWRKALAEDRTLVSPLHARLLRLRLYLPGRCPQFIVNCI